MIDLRSDTVTKPTAAMRQAMTEAEVGDDVFGDDPTVRRLEETTAGMLGKEAGLFVASGTQSNLVALLTHCGRGDEYIVGQKAHTYIYEGGGGAALGGIQPQPLGNERNGTLDLTKIAALVKPNDFHFARTRLLCLENTFYGKVLPFEYLADARALVDQHGLRLHMDGARLFNAAIASGRSAAQLAAPADTVSICLSKGLGAPVGSVLVGDVTFVEEARRWRKVVGGGMRQSGILAAAGIHALENHVDRLVEDHDSAERLAHGLSGIDGVELESVATNMVFVRFPDDKLRSFSKHLEENGILALADYAPVRFVTHLDVDAEAIDFVVRVIGEFFGSG
ncbi:MAG: low-specificity L-threonine aldolase [Verrucomicrobiota bacterium]